MKISKSFKIYTLIAVIIFFMQQVFAEANYSKNIVVHKEPIDIKELKFIDFDFKEVDLTNKKGNIVILNFWATWCAPCKKEMPSLDKLAQLYPDIKVYAINLEKPNKEKTLEFFKDLNITNLKIYFDPSFNLVKVFNMRGMPTSILIDKNGKEFAKIIGEVDFSEDSFVNFLKEYL